MIIGTIIEGIMEKIIDIFSSWTQHNDSVKTSRRELLEPKAELAAQIKEYLENALNSKDGLQEISQKDRDKQELLLKKLFSDMVNEKYKEVCALIDGVCDVRDKEREWLYAHRNDSRYSNPLLRIQGISRPEYSSYPDSFDKSEVELEDSDEGLEQDPEIQRIQDEINELMEQAKAGITSLFEDMQEEIDFVG